MSRQLQESIDKRNAAIMELEAKHREVCAALFEVVDAVASIHKPWDLQGYGIGAKRAEEICELAELGRPDS